LCEPTIDNRNYAAVVPAEFWGIGGREIAPLILIIACISKSTRPNPSKTSFIAMQKLSGSLFEHTSPLDTPSTRIY
jgi:hypothetical protein